MRLLRQVVLGEPDGDLFQRVLLNAGLAFVMSVPLLVGAEYLAGFLYWPASPLVDRPDPTLLDTVIRAPLIETFVLTLVLSALSALRIPLLAAASLSAAGWGISHSIYSPLAFFGVFPGFFLDACAYLVWRKRSYWHGYAAAALQHVIHNFLLFQLW